MRVALIGGTGIDEMECFGHGRSSVVTTKWGSSDIVETILSGREVVFIPRHGTKHQTPPAQINYRAQIAALKQLEVDAVISVCAVGSCKADLTPGTFAILADFIDLTKHRADTFYDSESGPVVHTDLTQPYCPTISRALAQACEAIGTRYRTGATYVGVEGPRYETPAEIRLYAAWGGDVIGMTNLPEAVLAREAGLCYGALAVVTNLACGISPTPLNHDEVRAAMAEAAANLTQVISDATLHVPDIRDCSCGNSCQLTI